LVEKSGAAVFGSAFFSTFLSAVSWPKTTKFDKTVTKITGITDLKRKNTTGFLLNLKMHNSWTVTQIIDLTLECAGN